MRKSYNFFFPALMIAAGLALITYIAFEVHKFPANCDIGWLVYATTKLEEGKILYKDLYEVNPPLIFLFHYLSNLIAEFFNQEKIPTFNLLVLFLAAVSCALSLRICLASFKQPAAQLKLTLGLLFYYFIFPASPRYVFGEREHLLLILVTPYLLKSYLELQNIEIRIWRKTCLALAMVGFIIKPYFLAIFIASELARNRGRNSFRANLCTYLVFAALIAGYIAITYLAFPAYFSEILPMALKTYGLHRVEAAKVIRVALDAAIPLVFILGFVALQSKKITNISYFISIITASFLVMIVQFKGWPYIPYPTEALSLLWLIFLAVEYNPRQEYLSLQKKFSWQVLLAVIAFTFVMVSLAGRAFFYLDIYFMFLESSLAFLPLLMIIFFICERRRIVSPEQCILLVFAVMLALLERMDDLTRIFYFINSPAALTGSLVCGLILFLAAVFFRKESLFYFRLILFLTALGFFLTVGYSNISQFKLTGETDRAYLRLENMIAAAGAKNVFIFNTNLYPAFPLVNYAHVSWGSRFHHLWMFPKFYEQASEADPCHTAPGLKAEKKQVYAELYDDLTASQPDLIMFDNSPQVFIWTLDSPFTWQKCLAKENIDLSNYIATKYTHKASINLCAQIGRPWSCNYEVYERK